MLDGSRFSPRGLCPSLSRLGVVAVFNMKVLLEHEIISVFVLDRNFRRKALPKFESRLGVVAVFGRKVFAPIAFSESYKRQLIVPISW